MSTCCQHSEHVEFPQEGAEQAGFVEAFTLQIEGGRLSVSNGLCLFGVVLVARRRNVRDILKLWQRTLQMQSLGRDKRCQCLAVQQSVEHFGSTYANGRGQSGNCRRTTG